MPAAVITFTIAGSSGGLYKLSHDRPRRDGRFITSIATFAIRQIFTLIINVNADHS